MRGGARPRGAPRPREEPAEPLNADLSAREIEESERRSAPRAVVVHEAISREGEDELRRPTSALAWSGLAAGLSMGFSLVGEGLLRAHLPDETWRPVIAKLGYTLGFLIVVLGRQQLFTENTLTPILPLLARRDGRTLRNVVRLWAVVLAANLAGAALFAFVAAHTAVFRPDVKEAFSQIGAEAVDGGFATILLRGIFAGWLIALMVWLLPFAESGRVGTIIVITFFVGLGGFSHVIAGSVEVLYRVTSGDATWWDYAGRYLAPTLLGNVLGGVSLVAALNHAQVVSGGGEDV